MGFIKFLIALCIIAACYPNEADVYVWAILLAGFIAYGGGHRDS